MSILDERRKILHSYNENRGIKNSAREFLNASSNGFETHFNILKPVQRIVSNALIIDANYIRTVSC